MLGCALHALASTVEGSSGSPGGVQVSAREPAMYPQVRQLVLPASEATGPCRARALAQQLWDGEEFCLQVMEAWETC